MKAHFPPHKRPRSYSQSETSAKRRTISKETNFHSSDEAGIMEWSRIKETLESLCKSANQDEPSQTPLKHYLREEFKKSIVKNKHPSMHSIIDCTELVRNPDIQVAITKQGIEIHIGQYKTKWGRDKLRANTQLLLDSIAIGFLSPVILDWLKLAGVSLWEGSALIQLHDLTADKPTVWRVILNLHPSQTFIDATNAVISDIEPLVMTPYSLRRAQTIEASTSRPIIKRVNARRLSEDKVDRKPSEEQSIVANCLQAEAAILNSKILPHQLCLDPEPRLGEMVCLLRQNSHVGQWKSFVKEWYNPFHDRTSFHFPTESFNCTTMNPPISTPAEPKGSPEATASRKQKNQSQKKKKSKAQDVAPMENNNIILNTESQNFAQIPIRAKKPTKWTQKLSSTSREYQTLLHRMIEKSISSHNVQVIHGLTVENKCEYLIKFMIKQLSPLNNSQIEQTLKQSPFQPPTSILDKFAQMGNSESKSFEPGCVWQCYTQKIDTIDSNEIIVISYFATHTNGRWRLWKKTVKYPKSQKSERSNQPCQEQGQEKITQNGNHAVDSQPKRKTTGDGSIELVCQFDSKTRLLEYLEQVRKYSFIKQKHRDQNNPRVIPSNPCATESCISNEETELGVFAELNSPVIPDLLPLLLEHSPKKCNSSWVDEILDGTVGLENIDF